MKWVKKDEGQRIPIKSWCDPIDDNALAQASNKMYFQLFPEEVRPATLITRDRDEIHNFAKEHEALKAVSLSTGGRLLPGTDLAKLADLPTLDQARAMLLGLMVAPMTKLARTLAEPPAMLARTLSARASQEAA